ncbi:uncharacterized protein LOC111395026 [Olea europaea var. sylvestris]|uniref:uncharacterized protein LOC111395026 n=1 Tax=Olea europaea var. sylvestris TaxID=158386 RepID=UPI000C1CE6AE|nr:uncharacterized protein LOC111395026 [Olea europaea var. sylvestris]
MSWVLALRGPPVIAFEFRHWGYLEVPFKGHASTGELVQFYGIGILNVDESLRAEDVEVYYDPTELFAGLLKGPLISGSERTDSASVGLRTSFNLFYSVCGSKMEAQLAEFRHGETKGNLAEISMQQHHSINSLYCKTVKEEDKLSNRMLSANLASSVPRDQLGGEMVNTQDSKYRAKERKSMTIHSYYLNTKEEYDPVTA